MFPLTPASGCLYRRPVRVGGITSVLIAAIRAAFAVHDGLWGLQQQVQRQMQQQRGQLDKLNAELATTDGKVELMTVSWRAAMNRSAHG